MPPDPNDEFEIFNEQAEFLLKELGDAIARQLPEEWGFTLLLNSLGENSELFFTTNIDQRDMLQVIDLLSKKQHERLDKHSPSLPPGDSPATGVE